MSNQSSIYYNMTDICLQRARRQLLIPPPVRFNPVSPYPQYTQFQLDMRRKTEILKYKANATNTKTNNFTKAELYAQLVSGNNRISQQTLVDISNGIVQCVADELLATPTSSCDVPGPVILLNYDPTIPLYNYAFNVRNYGIINPNDTLPWSTYTTNDILINLLTEYFTLYIQNNITNNTYYFQFTSPVGISLQGGAIVKNYNITNQPPNGNQIVVSISNIYVYVYYDSTLISSNDPNANPSQTIAPIVQSDFLPLVLNVQNQSANFSATFFSGTLLVGNLFLFTQPGFIYDIKVQVGLTITTNLAPNYSYTNIVSGMVGNFTTINSSNCIITSSPSTDINNGFLFSGVSG